MIDLPSPDPLPERSIPTADSIDSHDTARRRRLLLLLAIGLVAVVRLWFCMRTPVNTADVLRSIHTALYVLRDGPGVAGIPLVDLDAGLGGMGWARISYSYPPLALPFFVVVAAISPTLFAAKLALTLVEAANAVLLARITGSRVLGAIYWASPASIWWVSGEGQFEPWMAFFMFAAVAVVKRHPTAALTLLGLGVNVKLTAVLLLPWFLLTVWRNNRRAVPIAAAAFAAALAGPLLLASLWYPVAEGLLGIAGTLRYNPYYWNPFDAEVFLWNPDWLRSVNALTTYAVLAFMAYRAFSTENGWAQLGGAIAFVTVVKVASLAQFWYFLLFPAFVMPVEPREYHADVRFWLVLLAPLLDVRSLVELFAGPFGWTEVGTYQGLSAFTQFGIR